ncbi:MAG: tRNA pseudouridine(13) synthase TruD [Methanomicrobiales archaeon]|nr:tRNA pseudouridine(13) synthase TruD [Methanomicrobiales archaeon]
MMPTPHPLERSLGIGWYASTAPGIGGRLKAEPEDFCVDELPLAARPAGSFLICRITKRNWETQRAVREIAKQLGISHKRISWAGTKDKRAVTSQYISIAGAAPGDIAAVRLKDISIEIAGTADTPLMLGDLAGNRFQIRIRDCDPLDLATRVRAGVATAESGVPNYFGIQRFGVIRPITHLVGRHILKREYEEAVAAYIGLACDGEPEPIREARQAFYDTRNALGALKSLPVPMQYERTMLHALIEHPGEYRQALLALPPKLRSMFVSAYQSWLFNHGLSGRCAAGVPLYEPVPGDRLLFLDGREDAVTEKNLRTAEVHIRRGRCTVAIRMPGTAAYACHGIADETIGSLLDADGITSADFGTASEFLGVKYEGAVRAIGLKTDIAAEIRDTTVELAFDLPPGHYATTVCREFMKAPPLQMI